jgi:hypothetical protein
VQVLLPPEVVHRWKLQDVSCGGGHKGFDARALLICSLVKQELMVLFVVAISTD